jgi:hypothetical protein
MKPHPISLILAICMCLSLPVIAQQDPRYRLELLNSPFTPQKDISEQRTRDLNRRAVRVNRKFFAIIQFESIPTAEEKLQLQRSGIELIDYIPRNSYSVTVRDSLSFATLTRVKARAVVELSPEQKMHPSLAQGIFPAHAVKRAGSVDVLIGFPRTFAFDIVRAELSSRNIDVVSTTWVNYNIVGLRISTNRLKEIASLPFVTYMAAIPKDDEPVNNKSVVIGRGNVLHSALPGGRNLKGEGVVIGIGDDANPLNHIDFNGRLINRSAMPGNSHGVHVTGTAAGGGIIYEPLSGYAPKSTIVAQAFSNILAYAPEYVNDFGMVITNNSYGNVDACYAYGVYDLYSRVMDQQMFQMPNLQHVFASGNWNQSTVCPPYQAGFNNVFGSYQSAKNVITVGNSFETGPIHPSSCKGPTRDGRIKPEITAQGTRVYSTLPSHVYNQRSGTSMASPAVSGGLALLYERYRQLHGGTNPKNGLMKALLCNGATDMGNVGPDFSYGFGWLNLLRSVTMLENNGYIHDSVNVSATKTHTITIPGGSNLAQLKVMLYWNDSAAAAFASHTLVNDLDLEVSDPSSTIHYPYVLDTVPAFVTNTATTGIDRVNNIEQVVLTNPGPGTYTFSVKGTTIPLGPRHEYFLVFDTIPVSTKLTYPIGGERMVMSDSIYVSWDSYGNPANDFTVQYSTDNGSTWTTINAAVSAGSRQQKWYIPTTATDPNIITEQAKIKLIHNGTGIESVSEAFTILGVPPTSVTQCDGYVTLNWTAVAEATDYEVMMLRGKEMVSIGTTAATTFSIGGLSRDTVYWVTSRARINGIPGRRANALAIQPNGGPCAGSISDNDLRMQAILSPASSGRKLTSTEFTNNVAITVRIKNLDNIATSGNIPVAYKIGSNPQINETIVAPNIAGGATFDYTFAATADLSATGTYPIKVSVSYPGDLIAANDTIAKTFKQLDNLFIDLNAADFVDDIETAAVQSHTTPQVGLEGLDRYDFNSSTAFGRISTFVNTGIANSGTKALTLDADRYNAGGTADTLKATFNLQGFNVASDDIRLDFYYKHHSELPNAANNVWIRGSDLQPWIQVYDLYANQGNAGIFSKSPSIEVSDALAANSQVFSSSFQVRWGQWGQIITADQLSGAGYTFDDIHLYLVTDDIRMISIDTPVIASCGLTTTTPVRITVRNNSNSTLTNIPVKFRADGGATVTETIASIAGNTSVSYTFTATADFSSIGNHTLVTWADLGTDTYRDNDTVSLTLNNAPVVTIFPYLQNFETDNGYWYSSGTQNSWQYGTPASTKINRAANGTKAWKTNLVGTYNDLEQSYLYSPCFDLSGMTTPTLSFSVALDLEDCGAGTLCDAAYLEYSADGITWTRLGTTGAGTNWYNRNYGGNPVWSVQDYTRWHVATIPLPTGLNRLRIRFVMQSDPYVSLEGIAIDDIHVYDNLNGIYTGPPLTSASVNQPAVSGTGWVNFSDGGKLIASINPNGQNLGNTDVQAFIYSGAVRVNSQQYIHHRNITVKPQNINLSDSVSVRFYFLDSETEALINASGCGMCSKPASAYHLGVTKYGDANDANENGTLADNLGNDWFFVIPDNVVKVPFDRGYYAEFKVKDFSEFWLNSGGPNNQSLPAELTNFTAKKEGEVNVLVEWTTASENNIVRYEIEVARGEEEYRQTRFAKIGEVAAIGNSSSTQHYQFIDAENNKSGVRYYRLKIIDLDGGSTYSAIKPVVFDEAIKWQVYPNPSTGLFSLVYQANIGSDITLRVYDLNGKEVRQSKLTGTGFIQRQEIDLRAGRYAPGMYLLELNEDGKKHMFRLLKQ